MKAVVITEPQKCEITEVPDPVAGPEEVVVRTGAAGICGTDLHILKGDFVSDYPIIPGHEFSGVIESVGLHVNGWKPGDRVVVDPSLFCGECSYCLTGKTNMCTSFKAIGVNVPGALAELVSVPQRNLYPLANSVSYIEGGFTEPLACVTHGINRLNPRFGDRAIIFGAGSIGLQLIAALSRSGVSELVAVDLAPDKLELAKSFGATSTFLSKELDVPQESFDIVVDATGIPSVIQRSLDYIGPAGKYLQFGVAPKNCKIDVDIFKLYRFDWTLIGAMAVNLSFRPALNWLQEKRIDVQKLVTHRLSLEEIPEILMHYNPAKILKAQYVSNIE